MDRNVIDTIDPEEIGRRIADSRRQRGLTQSDLAQALGVARTTVTAMERGDRRPKSLELSRIASILRTPVRSLIETPRLSSLQNFPVYFRKSVGESNAGLSEDVQTFQRLCNWYMELENTLGDPLPRRYPPPYEIRESAPLDRSAEEVAISERNRLGLGDGPITDIWGILESDIGLRIIEFPMVDKSTAGMFIYAEDIGGCIGINLKHPHYRKRWTAVHEFAHFLVDREEAEITILKKRLRLPRRERFADSFTRNFLMPAVGLVRRFESLHRSKQDGITPGDILSLAHQYAVSFEAMMVRLEELSLIPSGTYSYLRNRGFQPDKGRAILGLPSIAQEHQGPRKYLTLLAEAWQRQLITEGELSEYLSRSIVDSRESILRIIEQSDISDDGEWVQGSLDLTTSLLQEN